MKRKIFSIRKAIAILIISFVLFLLCDHVATKFMFYEGKSVSVNSLLVQPDPKIPIKGEIRNYRNAINFIASISRRYPRYTNISPLDLAQRFSSQSDKHMKAYLLIKQQSESDREEGNFDILDSVPVPTVTHIRPKHERKMALVLQQIANLCGFVSLALLFVIILNLIVKIIGFIKYAVTPEGLDTIKKILKSLTDKELLIKVALLLGIIYLIMLIIGKIF